MGEFLSRKVSPDWQGLVDCIMRKGTPARVHNIELFIDGEVKEAVCDRFDLLKGLHRSDPHYDHQREIIVQRFLGYDYVRCGLDDFNMPLNKIIVEDTAGIKREEGRSFINEQAGPVTTWEEFERYPWPDPDKCPTTSLEWYEKNLPEEMCIIGSGGFAHFAEFLNWLMGYETLCYALFENRGLVKAISDRLVEIYEKSVRRMLEFDRVKLIWGSDDMGFRGGPLISPDDLREFVLPGHKRMAEMSHEAGRPYLLHSCGNIEMVMEDLIEDVKIDARHSFEDVIEDVVTASKRYGHRIAHLGGIDVDFICRADEKQIRERVRNTLDACFEGGGYCLGTGNSVANYIPLDHYLAMLDEGRNWE